MVNKDFQ